MRTVKNFQVPIQIQKKKLEDNQPTKMTMKFFFAQIYRFYCGRRLLLYSGIAGGEKSRTESIVNLCWHALTARKGSTLTISLTRVATWVHEWCGTVPISAPFSEANV